MKPTKEMIDRFLSWRLPDDFCPDAHIHFDREAAAAFVESWPIGTNLLTAIQAEAMLTHVLAAVPDAAKPEPCRREERGPKEYVCDCRPGECVWAPTKLEMQPCAGMNCGAMDGVSHSPECYAEHAATIAGGVFVKKAKPEIEFYQTTASNGLPDVAYRIKEPETQGERAELSRELSIIASTEWSGFFPGSTAEHRKKVVEQAAALLAAGPARVEPITKMFKVVVDESVPTDELRFVDAKGNVIGRIIGIGKD